MEVLSYYKNRRMKIRFLAGMLFLCLALPAWAQQRMIRGRVVDQNGQPVASVLINVKGTNRAVSTGEDGTYQIEAKKGDVLAFSLIGFDKASVTVEAWTDRE